MAWRDETCCVGSRRSLIKPCSGLGNCLLYGDVVGGKRARRRPHIRLNNVFKSDMRAVDMNIKSWNGITNVHSRWRRYLHRGVKRARMKENNGTTSERAPLYAFVAIETVTLVWAWAAITVAAPPSAGQAWILGCRTMVTRDILPHVRKLFELFLVQFRSFLCEKAFHILLNLVFLNESSPSSRPFTQMQNS